MAEEEKSPDGVFGNLPSARPGSRSPRRNGGEEQPARPRATAAKREPAPPPPEPPPPPAPPAGTERETPVPSETAPKIQSVEDLAWAGIAVAAQAATVGVKFASRALEAARRSAERE
jgi:hypothetical protein